ncbi:MAG: EamA family transporter [Desulfovibrionaceae bacterium]|nr:EamA family transporter [Desulfovibrionaceae bacterium]
MASSTSREEWALFAVTTLWGASFLLIRLAMTQWGPLCFVGVRFTIATIVILLFSWPILHGITRREIVGGTVVGVITFLGFALQTYGLAEIESAKSGFLTAFYVPLVPVFELILMRHKPSRYAWLGMAVAFPGVLLMTGSGALPTSLTLGELATLLCAVVFACEIVFTGIFVPGTSPRRFVTVQLVVTAILAFITMPLMGESWPNFPGTFS